MLKSNFTWCLQTSKNYIMIYLFSEICESEISEIWTCENNTSHESLSEYECDVIMSTWSVISQYSSFLCHSGACIRENTMAAIFQRLKDCIVIITCWYSNHVVTVIRVQAVQINKYRHLKCPIIVFMKPQVGWTIYIRSGLLLLWRFQMNTFIIQG